MTTKNRKSLLYRTYGESGIRRARTSDLHDVNVAL